MKTKILSIREFHAKKPKTLKTTVVKVRAKLDEANAVWPFGWY